jgi:hypothetical protein
MAREHVHFFSNKIHGSVRYVGGVYMIRTGRRNACVGVGGRTLGTDESVGLSRDSELGDTVTMVAIAYRHVY